MRHGSVPNATHVGIDLTTGGFRNTPENIAKKILQEYDKECKVYKTAHTFLVAMAMADDSYVADLERDFRDDILNDFRGGK